ncbi:MAG TPA: DinB family protein [Bryobacteraceae bacterium]|nr:DinB family protein [Bryobacteraceae bacterium]
MNPYGKFLEGQNYMDVLEATPLALASATGSIGDTGLGRSYHPGKWTAAQILCHLADCEIAFGFRMRQALVENPHLVQPFDQESWAKSYDSLDPQMALETFTALRTWNLSFLKAQDAGAFSRIIRHPERGEMTLEGMLELIAGHDLNHRKQLETIAAAAA